ncbi:hypothetical protein [Vibrio cholerae]|uniref:hypothetical protein n=1 Tax=Vibrio cholerae TaxID=666 RepID=UPI001E4604F3|nr:hypothetical protein [Vibrio cholerae]MCD1196911.1 hypothetical protein [Vibrio cholerae]MCD1200640.1 hypothetical protein [Vibrio cholerae]MCD1213271.1 hypothetical protein [Vibrio cholerae]MCD1217002.1 hypothetical protein [Vibrio cholerae]MCD1235173.1 hypothetical protein [Vibrio cholerae]
MKLLTENIWSFISKSSRNSDKAYVAVAYLGNGASEKLLLKSGDMLVVDASESNVRSGVINPHELQKFVDSGVNVFSKETFTQKFLCLALKPMLVVLMFQIIQPSTLLKQ